MNSQMEELHQAGMVQGPGPPSSSVKLPFGFLWRLHYTGTID